MHYTPRQRGQPVQVFSIVMLVLFCAMLLTGQTAAATALALISLAVYLYGRFYAMGRRSSSSTTPSSK